MQVIPMVAAVPSGAAVFVFTLNPIASSVVGKKERALWRPGKKITPYLRVMAKIIITGAGGQLGREFATELGKRSEHRVWALDRRQLDVTDGRAVRAAFAEFAPDLCFHCAAYTAVDRAEAEAERAQEINVDGTAHVAHACVEQGSRLVHFSTDYVYDDGSALPRREEDPTAPKSVYASTKLDGEARVRAIAPTALILRTSWLYSTYGHNFVKTMLRLGRERAELRVVFDQIGGPTYARDLVTYLLALRLLDEKSIPGGVYNFSNAGVASWYDFCVAIFEMKAIDCPVHPIDTADYPTPAHRPAYSVLHTGKLREWGGPIRHWRAALREMLTSMAENPPSVD